MQSIHVQTNELRDFSSLMMRTVNLILDEEFKLRRAFSSLDMDWKGGRAEEFMIEAASVQTNLHARIDEFYELARRVNRESDRWEESDHTWVEEYRKVFGLSTGSGG